MLAAKKLPEILHDFLGDGIQGICLMTVHGSIVASAFLPINITSTITGLHATTINNNNSTNLVSNVSSIALASASIIDEITLAAITSSIWNNYITGNDNLTHNSSLHSTLPLYIKCVHMYYNMLGN